MFGFDFHELSARNKRVLRHYIELSVDGKLGDVEDIVAVASSPITSSPIELPLNLSQPAPYGTLQQFRSGLRNFFVFVVEAARTSDPVEVLMLER